MNGGSKTCLGIWKDARLQFEGSVADGVRGQGLKRNCKKFFYRLINFMWACMPARGLIFFSTEPGELMDGAFAANLKPVVA